MKELKEKKAYSAPIVRSVSFMVEQGFAGSDSPGGNIPFFNTTTNSQTESWLHDSQRDDVSGSFFPRN